MGDVVFANVFGVEFPVCNEDQKVRMEAAYQDAIEYDRAHAEEGGCSCDVIISLLSGTPPDRMSCFAAAFALAKDLYEKKAKIAYVFQALQAIEMESPRGNA